MSQDWPKGHLSQRDQLVQQVKKDLRFRETFDVSLESELQTDKELVKVLPCQVCRRALVVSTFYVLAWAKCSSCKGENVSREPGSVGQPQAGRTEPRLAMDLEKVLINPQFAVASCPMDAEHGDMELKSIHWSEHYGPHEYRMIDGKLTPVQIAPGEAVMLQCNTCLTTIAYSTTAVTKFKAVNEVKDGGNSNRWVDSLGARDTGLDDWAEKQDDFTPVADRLEELANAES